MLRTRIAGEPDGIHRAVGLDATPQASDRTPWPLILPPENTAPSSTSETALDAGWMPSRKRSARSSRERRRRRSRRQASARAGVAAGVDERARDLASREGSPDARRVSRRPALPPAALVLRSGHDRRCEHEPWVVAPSLPGSTPAARPCPTARSGALTRTRFLRRGRRSRTASACRPTPRSFARGARHRAAGGFVCEQSAAIGPPLQEAAVRRCS